MLGEKIVGKGKEMLNFLKRNYKPRRTGYLQIKMKRQAQEKKI